MEPPPERSDSRERVAYRSDSLEPQEGGRARRKRKPKAVDPEEMALALGFSEFRTTKDQKHPGTPRRRAPKLQPKPISLKGHVNTHPTP